MWLSGRTRPGTIGCGAVLFVASLAVGLLAVKSWREAGPAGDYVTVAVVFAVASVLFVIVGRRMTQRPLR
jgi:hypothetical protein